MLTRVQLIPTRLVVKQYVKAMNESGEIYNLRGMKVATPVKGQMYIQNGKKFIQK